jgi:hypothetical protein
MSLLSRLVGKANVVNENNAAPHRIDAFMIVRKRSNRRKR